MATIKLADALNNLANVTKTIKVGGVSGNRIEVYDTDGITIREVMKGIHLCISTA